MHYASPKAAEWPKFTSDQIQDGGRHRNSKLGYFGIGIFLGFLVARFQHNNQIAARRVLRTLPFIGQK